jgi:thiosulfate/3-mercaptopyruvate sulfurtransferase
VLALALVAAPGAGPEAAAQEYARPELLIETEELARIIHEPRVRVVDAADPASYQRAHLPGAVNLHAPDLARLESRKASGFPLPLADAERTFGAAGIGADTHVVVYDGGEGPFASGVWFVLDFFGHRHVRVLNGGFRKWFREGRPLTQDVPVVAPAAFVHRPRPEKVVTRDWLARNLRATTVTVVDARSFDEFIGREVRPGAARGGHIPGAVHLEWARLAGPVHTFKPAAQLAALLEQRGLARTGRVVTYCHTGIGRSTHVALALRLLGWDDVVQYTGSWEEWSSDPRLPIER